MDLIDEYVMRSIFWDGLELPMHLIMVLILLFILRFLFGVWASAGAILKVTELEKGSKLGLKEALSRGLKKVPKLVVPAIACLAINILIIAALAIAINPYVLIVIGMSPLAQEASPPIIVLRLAMGFLFLIGLYILIRLYLYAPACVLQNNYGLKTSWKLVKGKGNWWKLLAISLIFLAMSIIINGAYIIGSFLSNLIVGPFTIAAKTLIYSQLSEAKSSGEEHKESL